MCHRRQSEARKRVHLRTGRRTIALVSGGVLDAALVLAAIVLIQGIERHVLCPLLMGRTVHLRIVVALAEAESSAASSVSSSR